MTKKEKIGLWGCKVISFSGALCAVVFGVQAIQTQQPLYFLAALFGAAVSLEALYLHYSTTHSRCRNG